MRSFHLQYVFRSPIAHSCVLTSVLPQSDATGAKNHSTRKLHPLDFCLPHITRRRRYCKLKIPPAFLFGDLTNSMSTSTSVPSSPSLLHSPLIVYRGKHLQTVRSEHHVNRTEQATDICKVHRQNPEQAPSSERPQTIGN